MAVNGIELAPGQRWRTRAGNEAVVQALVSGEWWDVMHGMGPICHRDDGRFLEAREHELDLVELVSAPVAGDDHNALTFHPLPEISDAWIDWTGGNCPVAADATVEYRAKNGEQFQFRADDLDWAHRGDGADIAAYRVIGGEVPGLADADLIQRAAAEVGRTNPKDLIGDKKAAMHLLSPIAEIHWMIGQYAGMLKYGAWNWRAAGVRSSVYISAARRHLMAYMSGEEFDPVDGSHHLGNIMACAAILLEAREIGKLTDDRPPRFSHRPTLAWAEEQMATLKAQYADKTPHHYTIADSDVCEGSEA